MLIFLGNEVPWPTCLLVSKLRVAFRREFVLGNQMTNMGGFVQNQQTPVAAALEIPNFLLS